MDEQQRQLIQQMQQQMQQQFQQFEEEDAEERKEIGIQVNTEIGNIARPDRVQFTPGLPKTRSGKIMRRILRKVASGEHDQLGDTSTLLDPTVVDGVIAGAAEFLS